VSSTGEGKLDEGPSRDTALQWLVAATAVLAERLAAFAPEVGGAFLGGGVVNAANLSPG
jgi:hypothetical protein